MGENPFFSFLILLFFGLLISSAVFYQTVLRTNNRNAGDEVAQIRIDQTGLQGILQTWQEREERFDEAGKVRVRNIFVPGQASEEVISPEEEGTSSEEEG